MIKTLSLWFIKSTEIKLEICEMSINHNFTYLVHMRITSNQTTQYIGISYDYHNQTICIQCEITLKKKFDNCNKTL